LFWLIGAARPRPEFGPFLLGTAAFMIVAMWIFPEAVGKKQGSKD
jgi:hypothetical protein